MDLRIWALKPVFALALLSGPLVAQSDFVAGPGIEKAPYKRDVLLTCSFSLECFEGEACGSTEYTFDLNGLAGGLGPDAMAVLVTMESVGGNIELLGTASDEIMVPDWWRN